jgi:hypothetical protein
MSQLLLDHDLSAAQEIVEPTQRMGCLRFGKRCGATISGE